MGDFAGDFYDMTFGLNYHPNANVQIRPEIRYDWFIGKISTASSPYAQRHAEPSVDQLDGHDRAVLASACSRRRERETRFAD